MCLRYTEYPREEYSSVVVTTSCRRRRLLWMIGDYIRGGGGQLVGLLRFLLLYYSSLNIFFLLITVYIFTTNEYGSNNSTASQSSSVLDWPHPHILWWPPWIGDWWPDSDVVNLPPYTEFRPFIVLTVPYVRYEDGQAAHSISSHRSHRESWWWCCCGSWSASFRIRFGLLPEQLSGFRFIDRCSHCTSCKWCGSVKEVIRVMIRCRFGVKGGQDECRTTSAHIHLSPSVYTVFLWFSLHDLRLHGLLSGVINSLHCNWMVIVIDLWWMELLLSETVLSGGEVYRFLAFYRATKALHVHLLPLSTDNDLVYLTDTRSRL